LRVIVVPERLHTSTVAAEGFPEGFRRPEDTRHDKPAAGEGILKLLPRRIFAKIPQKFGVQGRRVILVIPETVGDEDRIRRGRRLLFQAVLLPGIQEPAIAVELQCRKVEAFEVCHVPSVAYDTRFGGHKRSFSADFVVPFGCTICWSREN
jgi:hypothetical protein